MPNRPENNAKGRFWHTRDPSSKAAILIEADVPKAQGISVPDPIQTFPVESLIVAVDCAWSMGAVPD